jgi:hypothetical protein
MKPLPLWASSDHKGKNCAKLAHFGAQKDPRQGSHQQATNKPPTSLRVFQGKCDKMAHFGEQERAQREQPGFRPSSNRYNPGSDGLLEVSPPPAARASAYAITRPYVPRSVRPRVSWNRFRSQMHEARSSSSEDTGLEPGPCLDSHFEL